MREMGRKPTLVRQASGLLPHLLFSVKDHAGMFNLRHHSRDVMGFDSPSLTPRAVDLTPSRLGHTVMLRSSGLRALMNIYIVKHY